MQGLLGVFGDGMYSLTDPLCILHQDGAYEKESDMDGLGLCPYDPRHNSTAVFVGESDSNIFAYLFPAKCRGDTYACTKGDRSSWKILGRFRAGPENTREIRNGQPKIREVMDKWLLGDSNGQIGSAIGYIETERKLSRMDVTRAVSRVCVTYNGSSLLDSRLGRGISEMDYLDGVPFYLASLELARLLDFVQTFATFRLYRYEDRLCVAVTSCSVGILKSRLATWRSEAIEVLCLRGKKAQCVCILVTNYAENPMITSSDR
ncbi:hypothetical protein WN48_01349 [Eufriesea mexicana]|uniref:Uncharacterized protein n=1 Tax=Eufriesea mexicana TaxID=516756 RepID=A0A310SQE4_9HYME|nr:hypothetical protein WN48_01349 [Eufriesea mexicana]